MVACHQNQCHQRFNSPLLPSGQYCGHGDKMYACRREALPHCPVWIYLRRNSFRKKKRQKNSFFYGNHFEEIRIWIRFSANPDSEQLLTKTKKELRQSPIVGFFVPSHAQKGIFFTPGPPSIPQSHTHPLCMGWRNFSPMS